MSDDDRDIFVEAMEDAGAENNDAHTEIRLNEPEIIESSSSVARTSVTEITSTIISTSKEDKMVPRSGQFIHIRVEYPEKVGSGMGAYFVYKVITDTNKPSFLKQILIVKRRFSDFLGLHDRLVAKYLSAGCIIPPAPEKDAFANTKTKFSSATTSRSSDESSHDFLEQRRAGLERYLQRISRHSRLVIDSDFREFLEEERDLPRSLSTHAISGASVKKLIRNVGDAVGKMTVRLEETDRWFEDKQVEMDNLERHLTMIYSSFDTLISQRRELANQTRVFAQFCSQLSHVEEHGGLARALAQLSAVEEHVGSLEERQAAAETGHLLGVVKDYLGLVQAVKDVLAERVRQHRTWQEAEAVLNKRRENKARAEIAGKTDKLAAMDADIKESETRVERTHEDFENISKAIRKELETFDSVKIRDFKDNVIKMLESMISSQEDIITHWEKYVPETAGITS